MQRKFGMLRFTASVFKVLGIVAGIFAVIACGLTIVAASAGPQMMRQRDRHRKFCGYGFGRVSQPGCLGLCWCLFSD